MSLEIKATGHRGKRFSVMPQPLKWEEEMDLGPVCYLVSKAEILRGRKQLFVIIAEIWSPAIGCEGEELETTGYRLHLRIDKPWAQYSSKSFHSHKIEELAEIAGKAFSGLVNKKMKEMGEC